MTDLRRRTLIGGGLGLLAAGIGAAVSWRRSSPVPMDNDALTGFWNAVFETPAGGEPLSMANFRGQPLLVNFWATWCPPCVEEMPLLDAFYQSRRERGWQVLGLAVDQVPAVQQFLRRLPVSFPIAMAGLGGVELSRSLGNATGGLPFTVLVSPSGDVVHRQIGKVSASDLEQWDSLI